MTHYNNDTIYKTLNGRAAMHGGTYTYRRNTWTKHLDPAALYPCRVGYHVAQGQQVLGWLGPDLWIAEVCPDHDPIDHGDKLVTCRARIVDRVDSWTDETARLFAVDVAEAALLGERAMGREPDGRSWAAVEAARLFVRGEIDDVARAAAAAAGWAAAGDAAGAAARAAAGDAAGAAARAAAGDAAGAAAAAGWAAAAARAAAGATQYERLCHYLNGTTPPPITPLYGNNTP